MPDDLVIIMPVKELAKVFSIIPGGNKSFVLRKGHGCFECIDNGNLVCATGKFKDPFDYPVGTQVMCIVDSTDPDQMSCGETDEDYNGGIGIVTKSDGDTFLVKFDEGGPHETHLWFRWNEINYAD